MLIVVFQNPRATRLRAEEVFVCAHVSLLVRTNYGPKLSKWGSVMLVMSSDCQSTVKRLSSGLVVNNTVR